MRTNNTHKKPKTYKDYKKRVTKMGLFADVEDAEVSQGGVYFLPGLYINEISKCKTQRSQRNNKDYFIVECMIKQSTCEELPAGRKASQVIDINNIMGPPNIKAFVAAASGLDPVAPNINELLIDTWKGLTQTHMTIEQICERVVAADNPLEGIELFLEATLIKTRAGNPFTKHFWSPVSEEHLAKFG